MHFDRLASPWARVASGALVLSVVGCGAAPPEPAAHARPSTSSSPPALPPAAAEVDPTRCKGAAHPPATPEAVRTERGSLSALGPWIVEVTSAESRVWDVSTGIAKLRGRIDGSDLSLVKGDAIRAMVGDDVVFFDPTSGGVARVPRDRVIAESNDSVFARGDDEVRRLAIPKLAPTGAVPWKKTAGPPGFTGPLEGGSLLVAEGALLSFDRKAALRTGLSFFEPSGSPAHLLAFDPASNALVDVAKDTGLDLGKLVLPSAAALPEAVSFAPNPRFVFWFERGPETDHSGAQVVVVTGDLQTGQSSRFVDPSTTWSIAVRSEPFLEPGGERLCVRMISYHGSWAECAWRLDATGHSKTDPHPTSTPAAQRVGPGGILELATLSMPGSDRRLVLSYHQEGEQKLNLRLGIFRGAKLERSLSLEPGNFYFDDAALKEAWRAHEFPELPRLAVLDDRHVVFLRGTGSLADLLIDVETGMIAKACEVVDDCEILGRRAGQPKKGVVVDLLTGARIGLDASPDDWAKASHVEAPCR